MREGLETTEVTEGKLVRDLIPGISVPICIAGLGGH